ncbi:MAG: hypothetical protein LCH32_08765 [Bacteroidetes bacterium]|nr:hypothetical protein [Bacteroidota bacterium]
MKIKTTGVILVNRNVEKVFDFFSNPSNDKLWRTEINKSILDGQLQLGVSISEYSYLSKKVPNNLIELKCIEFNKNKIAIFETLNNAQFYLKSVRQVRAISNKTTEIIYMLTFDSNLVKHAFGFTIPKFIISYKAKSDIKKYLQLLKTKIENDC